MHCILVLVSKTNNKYKLKSNLVSVENELKLYMPLKSKIGKYYHFNEIINH